jgi:hypothetical protein
MVKYNVKNTAKYSLLLFFFNGMNGILGTAQARKIQDHEEHKAMRTKNTMD